MDRRRFLEALGGTAVFAAGCGGGGTGSGGTGGGGNQMIAVSGPMLVAHSDRSAIGSYFLPGIGNVPLYRFYTILNTSAAHSMRYFGTRVAGGTGFEYGQVYAATIIPSTSSPVQTDVEFDVGGLFANQTRIKQIFSEQSNVLITFDYRSNGPIQTGSWDYVQAFVYRLTPRFYYGSIKVDSRTGEVTVPNAGDIVRSHQDSRSRQVGRPGNTLNPKERNSGSFVPIDYNSNTTGMPFNQYVANYVTQSILDAFEAGGWARLVLTVLQFQLMDLLGINESVQTGISEAVKQARILVEQSSSPYSNVNLRLLETTSGYYAF
jgi:hypothetical protein